MPVASKSAASKLRPLHVNDEAEAAALSPARMKTRQPNSAGRCTIEDAMKVALGDVITVLASDAPNAKAFHGEVVEVTRFEACSSDEESDNGGAGLQLTQVNHSSQKHVASSVRFDDGDVQEVVLFGKGAQPWAPYDGHSGYLERSGDATPRLGEGRCFRDRGDLMEKGPFTNSQKALQT